MYARPMIDAHFHVFQRQDVPQYQLLTAGVVQRDFTLDDYRRAMGPAHLVGGVIMQVADLGVGMDELAFVERLPRDPLVGRYVSYLPIDRADAPEIVDQLAGHPLVAGIRYSHLVDDHGSLRDPEACLGGLRALARRRMVYELSIRPWQYGGLYELASRVPELTIILGHLGKPRITAAQQRDWSDGIARLASLPNVFCKVSVALESPDDPPYDPMVVRPLVRHVVECFGFDRVLFGSNFPVNFISVSCSDWLEMLDVFLSDASPTELACLYSINATRVYDVPATDAR